MRKVTLSAKLCSGQPAAFHFVEEEDSVDFAYRGKAVAPFAAATAVRYALAAALLNVLRDSAPLTIDWRLDTDDSAPLFAWVSWWWLIQLRTVAARVPSVSLVPPVDCEQEASTRYSSNDSAPVEELDSKDGSAALLFPALDGWILDEAGTARRVPILTDAALPFGLAQCLNCTPAPYLLVDDDPADRKQPFPDALLPRVIRECGGFAPLGGHKWSWAYSPFAWGAKKLLKRCIASEACFYLGLKTLSAGAHDAPAGVGCASAVGDWLQQATNAENSARWAREFGEFMPGCERVVFFEKEAFIELENATLLDPEVFSPDDYFFELDLKIGTVLFGLDADREKRERMLARAQNSTSGATGLCLIAYRGHEAQSDRALSRAETRAILTPECMRNHLMQFFQRIAPARLRELRARLDVLIALFSEQRLLHLNGSSLLLSYNRLAVTLKIIDFPHASLFHAGVDTSTLTGLYSLRAILKDAIVHACPRRH